MIILRLDRVEQGLDEVTVQVSGSGWGDGLSKWLSNFAVLLNHLEN